MKNIFILIAVFLSFSRILFSQSLNYAKTLSERLNYSSFKKADDIFKSLNLETNSKVLYFRIKNLLGWAEYLERAKRYEMKEKLREARVLLNKAERLFRGNCDFMLLRAVYLDLISRRRLGYILLLKLKSKYEGKPYYEYLVWKYASYKPDPFCEKIVNIIDKNPHFLKARFDRARALFNLGVLHDAFSEAKYLARLMPSSPWIQTFYGVCFLEHNNPLSAIGCFRRALRIEDYSPAVFELGRSLYLYGKLDESLPHFKNTLKLNKAHVGAHYYLGKAYMILGQRRKAVFHFLKYLKYNPGAVDTDDIKKWIKKLKA